MDTRKIIILSLVLLSYFITAIDASIVITGLTRITADLQLNHKELSWVQNAYLLSFGGFMLMGGGLGDAFGRKRIFNLSLIMFGIGSLGAGMAGTAGVMIAARFVQGIGSALLAPTSLALIMDYFDGSERVKAVAWYGSISGLGLCVGLIMGGAITDYASWRDGFLVNIPIIAAMLLFSERWLSGSTLSKAKFDTKGMLLSISGIFCLLYAIDGAENTVIWLAVGFVLMSAFVCVEHKSPVAIMPLRLFHNSDRRNAYIARALFVGAMMGFNFFISEFMQEAFHFSPLVAGCAFLPVTATTFVGAMIVPSLVFRQGNKRVLALGLSLLAIGFCALLPLNNGSNYLTGIALPMLFVGLGNGLSMSPLTNLGISGVLHKDAGAASGLVNVTHQIGGAFGLSFMVAASDGLTDMAARFHMGMLIALGCIVLALLVSCMQVLIRHIIKPITIWKK
ncbi:MFS transporter [Parabacteroides merdae]|uniref:MFS transporter n=3 Tax=Parabacteroides merdae TaxID=46503 RepID=UPI0034A42B87